jgi:hypothetical protein
LTPARLDRCEQLLTALGKPASVESARSAFIDAVNLLGPYQADLLRSAYAIDAPGRTLSERQDAHAARLELHVDTIKNHENDALNELVTLLTKSTKWHYRHLVALAEVQYGCPISESVKAFDGDEWHNLEYKENTSEWLMGKNEFIYYLKPQLSVEWLHLVTVDRDDIPAGQMFYTIAASDIWGITCGYNLGVFEPSSIDEVRDILGLQPTLPLGKSYSYSWQNPASDHYYSLYWDWPHPMPRGRPTTT